MTDELIIDPGEVERAFLHSMYTDEEVEGYDRQKGEAPPGAVIVRGIVGKYGFHPERLEATRQKVLMWLEALPTQFHKSGGGGWSFLNACNQANGRQWTGLHQRMEQLLCLAMGLGLAKCLMPRDMWSSLPGGMPYYVVLTEGESCPT